MASIQIDETLAARLQALASQRGMSLNETLQDILDGHLFFDKFSDTASFVLWVWDVDTQQIVYGNRAFLAFFDVPSADAVNLNIIQNALDSQNHPDFADYAREAVLAADDAIITWDAQWKNGRWMRTLSTPFQRHENGHVQQILGMGIDITTHKLIEDVLYFTARRGWKHYHRDFLHSIPPFLTQLLGVDYAYVGKLLPNHQVQTLVFAHQGEVIDNITYDLDGTPCEDIASTANSIHTDDVQTHYPHDQMLVDMGIVSYAGTQLWDAAGVPIGLLVMMHTQPMPDHDTLEHILQILAVRAAHELQQLHDEDALRTSYAVIKKSETRYRKLIESAPVGILVVNQAGVVIQANAAINDIFGYYVDDLVGQSIGCLMDDAFQWRHQQLIDNYFKHPARYNLATGRVVHARHKSGERIAVNIALNIVDYEGEAMTLVFATDMRLQQQATEARRTAELLRVKLDQEKEINELKSRFMSMVAHEFRTPMSVILTSLDLLRLKQDTPPAEQFQRLDKIQDQVTRLRSIVDEVATLSKNQLIRRKVNFQAVSLPDLIQNISTELGMAIPNRAVIQAQHHPLFEEPIFSDELLIHQILSNLLSNALKYSKPNSRIQVRCQPHNGRLCITIKDQGIGIPTQEQDRLFQVFYRASNAQHITGTGMGLVIVQQAVEALQGEISFESAENEGTTFTVWLPYAPAPTE